MKKITIICSALFLVIATGCKENASSKINASNIEAAKERDAKISLGAAVMELNKTEHDFGTIVEGAIVEDSFMVTNTGKTDLILTEVKASCGCTTPAWPKDPIKPGESGEIKFVFNSNGRVGKQNKSITIRSNAEKVTEIVRIKGTVTAKG